MELNAIEFEQNGQKMYLFSAPAKSLWSVVQINKRTDDKEDGYQRALSESRALDIKKFLAAGNFIAPSIIIAFEQGKASFNSQTSKISIEDSPESGWVIDGQHRLRGAELSEQNINLSVVAFIGLDIQKQIEQFIIINKEAKGVPTSLYYDLLKMLPTQKNPSDSAKEKAAAIAESLRKDASSIFFERIVIVTSPKNGEISLNNFVRKLSPLIVEGKGSLQAFTQREVAGIIENYFRVLKIVFPDQFSLSKQRFFQTLGFGAAMNALFPIFSLTVSQTGGFRVEDLLQLMQKAEGFNFNDWDKVGTGSSAEIQAGRDFESHFKSVNQETGTGSSIRLF